MRRLLSQLFLQHITSRTAQHQPNREYCITDFSTPRDTRHEIDNRENGITETVSERLQKVIASLLQRLQ